MEMIENVSIVSESIKKKEKKKKGDDNLKKMWTSWTTFYNKIKIR